MRYVKLSHLGRRRGATSFWRCGVRHTAHGATYAEDAFTAEEWKRLREDPMLEVAEVDAPVPTPDDAAAELAGAIAGVIADLGPDDFGRDGKPNVGPVREALPDHARAITKKIVDEVFSKMRDSGFEAPKADADAPGPGETISGGETKAPAEG